MKVYIFTNYNCISWLVFVLFKFWLMRSKFLPIKTHQIPVIIINIKNIFVASCTTDNENAPFLSNENNAIPVNILIKAIKITVNVVHTGLPNLL